MKAVVLTTVGTTGDLFPFIALAKTLKARGHPVRLVSHALHRARVEGAGIEFVPVGAPFTLADVNALFDSASKLAKPLDQYHLLARQMFFHDAEQSLRDHLKAMEDAAVVVSSRFDYLGQEAAIDLELPWASVTLSPSLIRTSLAPVYPLPKLGRWFSNLTWNGLEAMARPLNRTLSIALVQLGAALRPLEPVGAMSPHLNLVAASRHMVDVYSDWPSNVVVTGAWLDEPAAAAPDPELAAFLQANPDPVVVTFGSMGGNAEGTDLVIGEALERVGCAAVVQAGYTGLFTKSGAKRERIFCADWVPHDHLFARASVVVHHAGGGTSTAACRFGAPSVPVPHLFDQYYWAGALHARGVAPRPLRRQDLTARALASRIESALKPKRRRAAQELAQKIAEEHGTKYAAEEIEKLLERRVEIKPAEAVAPQ